MEFLYFVGPLTDMRGLDASRKCRCDLCGREEYCFDVDDIEAEFADDSDYGAHSVCWRCAREGRLLFAHRTQVGDLYPGEELPTEVALFPPGAAEELMRTPPMRTIQDECWLTHCNDFMVYLGDWRPRDFRQSAPDGDGLALMKAMTGTDQQGGIIGVGDAAGSTEFWRRSEPDVWAFAGSMRYHAFRCRHCGELRGYFDFD